MRFVLLTFAVGLSTSQALIDIVVLSQANLTAVVGDRFSLPCSTSFDKPVRWLYQKTRESDAIELGFNGKITNGHSRYFELDKADVGQYNLVIKAVQLHHAGVYTCVEENGQGDQHIRFLNVQLPATHRVTTKVPTSVGLRAVNRSTAGAEYTTNGSLIHNCRYVVPTVCVMGLIITLETVFIFVIYQFKRKAAADVKGDLDMINYKTVSSDAKEKEPLRTEEQDENWPAVKQLAEKMFQEDEAMIQSKSNDKLMFIVVREPNYFSAAIKQIVARVQKLEAEQGIDVVVGINASDCRGEILAIPIADRLRKPYVPIVIGGYASDDVLQANYSSRFGTDASLEIQKDAVKPNQRVIIMDSYLVTGSSVKAAISLIEEQLHATVVECIVFTAVEHHEQIVKRLWSPIYVRSGKS